MVHSSWPPIVTSKQSSYKWQVPLLLSKELHWHSSVLWHFFKHSLEVLEEPAKNYSSKGWRNCRIVDPCTLIMFQFLCVGANSFDTTSAIAKLQKIGKAIVIIRHSWILIEFIFKRCFNLGLLLRIVRCFTNDKEFVR